MIRYALERVGSLLLTKAAVAGPLGVNVIRLLVHTGSVYTVLSVEVLEAVGCSPAVSREHVRIITGSGYLVVPKVQITWLQCLGQKIDEMTVVAHTLPMGSLVDGLLGMDFLSAVDARILPADGAIEMPS